jgi:hypothetical protein
VAFAAQAWITLRDKHFPPQKEHISIWISFALWPFAHKTRTTECCYSLIHTSSTGTILTTKPASERRHARLLPRLSWSWTVLLPSNTYRKPITSITTVLLPFMSYLLTLPRNIMPLTMNLVHLILHQIFLFWQNP